MLYSSYRIVDDGTVLYSPKKCRIANSVKTLAKITRQSEVIVTSQKQLGTLDLPAHTINML